ncbi:MAG: family 43 glycosylhydrolase [Clostridiales bacterium]|nr:family 43 glycosylhydrolase [Clostridiales bacterium]
MSKLITDSNPILKMDFPDPDVIFVDGVYYMISTTMHFLPGGQILRSYDLLHWEHAAYVFDYLDGTDAQKLCDDKYVYGKGMWAASLRYHKGTFYVVFVCNDTWKTYLFRSEKIEGPWRKSEIEGFYHDCSLLFDDDDRIYVVYGNRQIYLTELNSEMTGPKEGGIHRLIVEDSDETRLGYEGSHLYKINGRYYLFFIHSLKERWRRVEACFSSDSLEGEFTGGDILDDDMGFRDSGVAQGGIVCGVDGVWNAILFQDSGAIGRIPVVVPASWDGEKIVFGIDGKVPHEMTLPVSEKCPVKDGEYEYSPLIDSDDFKYGFPWGENKDTEEFKRAFGTFGLRSIWQFNHEPDLDLVFRDEKEGKLWITTDKLSQDLNHARNTLTQRMTYPGCTAEVSVDASQLRDGDRAGLCVLQGDYCWVGMEKREGKLFAVMYSQNEERGVWDLSKKPAELLEEREVSESIFRLRIETNFTDEKDEAVCFVEEDNAWKKIGGTHKLRFRLDHFTGARFGLFLYSTKESGGKAGFSDFRLGGN